MDERATFISTTPDGEPFAYQRTGVSFDSVIRAMREIARHIYVGPPNPQVGTTAFLGVAHGQIDEIADDARHDRGASGPAYLHAAMSVMVGCCREISRLENRDDYNMAAVLFAEAASPGMWRLDELTIGILLLAAETAGIDYDLIASSYPHDRHVFDGDLLRDFLQGRAQRAPSRPPEEIHRDVCRLLAAGATQIMGAPAFVVRQSDLPADVRIIIDDIIQTERRGPCSNQVT